jgi:uncharacterized protein DUF3551
MRKTIILVAAIATAAAVSPARAQTYNPAYPICLQTFGITGNAISCGYTSMGQCRATASARAAQCIVNPYFAGAPGKSRTRRGPY